MSESLAKFLADCRSEAPLAAEFFEEAADLAKSMGYLVGRGNTSDRRYYVVRVKKDCGLVSFFAPNIIEFYFNRLCEGRYLEENQAVDLYRYLQNAAKKFRFRLAEGTRLRSEVARNLHRRLQRQGFQLDSNHRRGNVILLTELDDKAPRDRIFKIYKEVLERVDEYGCLRTSL